MKLLKIIKALIVRLSLVLHVLITVWRVTVDLDDDIYWLLTILMVPFFIESAYTIIKRNGEDFLLFTPCFFFYLITAIPCIWLLEMKKSDKFLDEEKKDEIAINATINKEPVGPDFGVDINPGTWTVLIEELLLYLLIICRWIIPRGKVSREQLSDLLFAFIGIASDIMEMFSLFGLEDVRRNRILSYFVLSCWSLSVLQFCMTVTVTHEPRRGKTIKTIDDNDYEKKKPTIVKEILAIFCSMMMQDIPFLTLRLYTIITYNIINYSLIFFTAKNILVILLLLYKIAVLLQKRYCPEFLLTDDEEEEEIYDGEDGKANGGFSHIKEDLSDDSKDGKSNRGFDDDSKPPMGNTDTMDSNTPPDAARSLNQPNEMTPLRHRKGDIALQPSPHYNTPSTPQNASSTPSLSPSSQTATSTPSQDEGPSIAKPVSSGFGWVSSKAKTES